MIERRSYCRICPGLCGVVVSIEDERIVAIRGDKDNPGSRGYTCIKGLQNAEFHHSPNRILHPMERIEGGGHRRTTSAAALDDVAARVARIVEQHGPGAVALFVGTQAATNIIFRMMSVAWLKALGSPSLFFTQTIDQSAKWVAEHRIGKFAGGRQSFHDADVWLLVGNNPLVSISGAGVGIPQYNPLKHIREARQRGMKLIVVDPCRTQTAQNADLFLQIIPGEDPTLFAAILRVILSEAWHDQGFCDRYVTGLDDLRAAVEPFTLDYAAARTGVPADQIHAAAAMFARDARRGMAGTGTGPDMSPRSNLAEHLIQCLNVVCGRYAREGDALKSPPILRANTPVHAEVIPPNRSWESGHRSRAGGYGTIFGQMMTGILADEILHEGEGRIRALFCAGSNPANALPDQRKAIRALKALDLLVTSEPRWAETARLATHVFAPKLAFERPDHTLFIEQYGLTDPFAQYAPTLLQPPPGSDLVDDWYIFWALGSRLGLQLDFAGVALDMTTAPTSDELLTILARHGGVPLDEVKLYPSGHMFDLPPVRVQPPRPGADARLEPMPADVAAELAEVRAEPILPLTAGGRFTHHMIVRRIRETVNSLGREFGAVQRRMKTNPVFLHPDDLAELRLAVGDMVRIQSELEEIPAIVAADANLRRGVAAMTHGWGGLPDEDLDFREVGASTCRLVTTDAHVEPINAMPRMSAIPVAFARDAAPA